MAGRMTMVTILPPVVTITSEVARIVWTEARV